MKPYRWGCAGVQGERTLFILIPHPTFKTEMNQQTQKRTLPMRVFYTEGLLTLHTLLTPLQGYAPVHSHRGERYSPHGYFVAGGEICTACTFHHAAAFCCGRRHFVTTKLHQRAGMFSSRRRQLAAAADCHAGVTISSRR